MQKGRDILSEYGRDVSKPQAPRATSGGVTSAPPTSYSPPVGPIHQHNLSPGLPGGTNHGMARCPIATSGGGRSSGPGIGGSTHRGGSQRG